MKEPDKKGVKKKEIKHKEPKAKVAKSKVNQTNIAETDFVQFAVTARRYKTLLTRKYLNRKAWVDPNPFEIQSFIPGTIISIDVKEGEIVKEGEPLLILEAMKMQNRIQMPFTAKIKKINVNVGDRIPKDMLMIELDAVEE